MKFKRKKKKKIDGFDLSDTPEQKHFLRIMMTDPPTGDENQQAVKLIQARMLSEWMAKLDRIMKGEVNEYRNE